MDTTDDLIFLIRVTNAASALQFRFESVNPAYLAKTRLTEAIIGTAIDETLPADALSFVRSQFSKAVQERNTLVYEEPLVVDGVSYLVETTLSPFYDESGLPSYLLGVTRDITMRKEAERMIRESEQRYRTLVQLSPDAILIHDGGMIVFCNDAAGRLFQVDHPDELLGKSLYEYIVKDARKQLEHRMHRIELSDASVTPPPFETKLELRAGERIPVEGTFALVEYNGKKIVQVILRDVTKRNLEKERLERLSQLDGLTNVANRRHFDLVLHREANRARRNKTPLSIILFDLDNFKKYNDYYGHLTGDDCLKRVTERACELLRRPGDLLARFGGEEFAVLLPETDLYGAEIVADTLREEIERLRIPHEQSEVSPFVTISLGVSCLTRPSNAELVPFLERADQALYSAKRQGKNRVVMSP
ncbi:diguanylate cyclase [Paenibacillus sp. TRM 82003]|nr:diguanylate cyclase [Paenibacillus sp. TRM 82003]